MPKKTIELSCPHCHEVWAKLSYGPDGSVFAKDVKILRGNKVLKDGAPLACSLCGYKYTSWDIFLAIGTTDKQNADNDKT